MNTHDLTEHAQRVRTFMELAKQRVPSTPTPPDEDTRLLRARLILEEALETIDALGVFVTIPFGLDRYTIVTKGSTILAVDKTKQPDIAGIVDGCADVSVVTIGTLLACGVADGPILELVDQNNLDKFGPGHSFRDDGKLIKPPGHKPPDIMKALIRQGLDPLPSGE